MPGAAIRIIDPWASEPAGAKADVIAGFMCFQNDSAATIRIVGASSEAVERIEIHDITYEEGIARMKKLAGVDVPPHGSKCLRPGSTHFMLIGIDSSIRSGADARLQIVTASGNELHAVLPQRSLINPVKAH